MFSFERSVEGEFTKVLDKPRRKVDVSFLNRVARLQRQTSDRLALLESDFRLEKVTGDLVDLFGCSMLLAMLARREGFG